MLRVHYRFPNSGKRLLYLCRPRHLRRERGNTIYFMIKPVRYQQQGCLHFITFSCYQRMKLFDSPTARHVFEQELERVRLWYGCYIAGYVVMPEHVHLLISEPERKPLSVVLQMLKQITSHKLGRNHLPRFWQVRYYDFPVWSSLSGLRSCAISIGIR